MVRQLSHETRWPLNPKDLLRGRVWSDARPASGSSSCHPTQRVCASPLDRAYMRLLKAALGRASARHVGREIHHHPDDIANIPHSIAGLRSSLMRWIHDAV